MKILICWVVLLMVSSFSSAAQKPDQTDPKVFITAIMHAKPGMRDELRQKLLQRAEHGRSEPGCIRFRCAHANRRSGHLFIE